MFWKKKALPSVSFATSVWEKDWRQILLDPEYLPKKQIAHHCFPFAEKILVINNVADRDEVARAAQKWVDQDVLSRIVFSGEEVLAPLGLERADFRIGDDAAQYENVNPDWIYYNALGPLTAIAACTSEYLLYLTGDVRLDEPLDWVRPSLELMEKEARFKVANPVWNGQYKEAKKESYRKKGPFYVASQGFSDQIFLVRKSDFCAPIYREIRADSAHYPRGDVFEKRVFSYMKNRGWERITFSRGTYTHENFTWVPFPKKV